MDFQTCGYRGVEKQLPMERDTICLVSCQIDSKEKIVPVRATFPIQRTQLLCGIPNRLLSGVEVTWNHKHCCNMAVVPDDRVKKFLDPVENTQPIAPS